MYSTMNRNMGGFNNMHISTFVATDHEVLRTHLICGSGHLTQQIEGVCNHLLLTAEVQQVKSFSCMCFKSGSSSDVDN